VATGLLGGTFDPPHLGHLALADAAIERFGLERLVVVVTGVPPHKHTRTDAETRFRLAETAFAGRDKVELSRHELERAGPSYTVETARWAAEEWGDAIFLVGADEFADFLLWRDPDEILEHVRLGVGTRPGYRREDLELVLANLAQPDRVEFFDIPALAISSREIRRRVADKEDIDGLVPERVALLVAELRLYR
jgi:nicotinate-nucleotide adenylyltransferase